MMTGWVHVYLTGIAAALIKSLWYKHFVFPRNSGGLFRIFLAVVWTSWVLIIIVIRDFSANTPKYEIAFILWVIQDVIVLKVFFRINMGRGMLGSILANILVLLTIVAPSLSKFQ
jgi:hypothetical protein